MALENLFDMVKADRYTQDGREAVIKAREAEVEDRVYQNGEISQATGLMKTPNGWVEPPKGKKPGAKKESKSGRKMSNGEISERKTKGISVEGIGEGKSFKNENGAKIDITGTGADGSIQFMVTTSEGTKQSHHARSKEEMERILSVNGYKAESKPDSRALLSHKDHVDLAKEVMANGENWTAEEIAKEWKLTKGDAAEVKNEVDHLTRTRNQDRQDREDQIRTNVNNTVADIMRKKKVDDYYSESSPEGSKALLRERYALNDEEADQVYENLKTAHNMGVAAQEAEEAARQRESNDSAPRFLTGDTRIRVRKETKDRTYTAASINGPREKLENL